MLSLQTVLPDTLELLKTLMLLPELKDMRLVGGASLALQYGHRRSVDLDFFGNTTEDTDELTAAIREKVEQVVFLEDCLRLASPKDIAAMKVNAVIGRGTKKDFIDIYFLLQHFSFDDLMQLYLQKYPDGSEYRALLSMAYFGDADSQPMPYMFENVEWETIKQHIRNEVDAYNRRSLSKQ